MSGDTANTEIWQNADVYLDPSMTATAPVDVSAPWATPWDAVGLLDGSEGFTEERDEKSDEFYAWGGILVKRTRSQQQRTISFVAMEDNDTVFALVNPGSTRTVSGGLTTSTIKVPTNEDFSIGFEVRDGSKVKRRYVKRATVSKIDKIVESEKEPTVYNVTVLLYPEADGTLYTEIEGDSTAS